MNQREDLHRSLRDRLLFLTESSQFQHHHHQQAGQQPSSSSSSHRPFNVKRKSLLSKHGGNSKSFSFGSGASSYGLGSGGGSLKMSMQDFVRMDPGYTPDIEHLVFPTRKRNPQQVAPINPTSSGGGGSTQSKTRSRLAEMFALSRHLQQRSADREAKAARTKNATTNRSIDSVLEPAPSAAVAAGLRSNQTVRRWVSAAAAAAAATQPSSSTVSASKAASAAVPKAAAAPEEIQHRQSGTTSRVSPAKESEMTSTRGSNISVLHLRSTSEPQWETTAPTSQSSPYNTSSRNYRNNASITSLKKHQSLGNAPSTTTSSNITTHFSQSQAYKYNFQLSTEMLADREMASNNRELSPVRWCDREVDGVYLGRSGWVQVQHRSLDERRNYNSLANSKRTGIKLADYHCNSEPQSQSLKQMESSKKTSRPAYLSLQIRNRPPQLSPCDTCFDHSPPSLTPIISPPPAFQDRNRGSIKKTRTFFGKTPFLPRANAIEDSDECHSPPLSPIPALARSISEPKKSQWKTTAPTSQPIPIQFKKPQVLASPNKNLSASNRISPMKTLPSPNRIPQTKSLEDTTASKRTQYQKYGDSSSSSSSSLGFRSFDSTFNPTMPRLSENTDSSIDVYEDADDEDNNSSSINVSIVSNVILPPQKLSPIVSNRRHRTPPRRSPAGSDSNKSNKSRSKSPSSTSSSSPEFKKSPINQAQPIRRSAPPPMRPPKEDAVSKVRRSRSLQLPERKFPSQIPAEIVREHDRRLNRKLIEQTEDSVKDELLREAEVVTDYLYRTRSRAAAQALLQHRYNNKNEEDTLSAKPTNGFSVYYVGNQDRQRLLLRGATSPNLGTGQSVICNSESCEFGPQCPHRLNQNVVTNNSNQFAMRNSQSYPSHQMSLESSLEVGTSQNKRPTSIFNGTKKRATERATSVEKMKIPTGASKKNSKNTKNRPKRGGSNVSTPDGGNYSDDKLMTVVEMRPGSAPADADDAQVVETMGIQQRSMSLPKSFLSANYQPSHHLHPVSGHHENSGGLVVRRGTESLGSSPGFPRKIPTPETSHTAPVTPLHEGGRRRSPLGGVVGPSSTTTANTTTSTSSAAAAAAAFRRAKATSTPQLLDAPNTENRKWKYQTGSEKEVKRTSNILAPAAPTPANASSNAESVLQKFRKTFSLRFHHQQRKGSKDSSCGAGSDIGEALSEFLGEPSEEESQSSPHHIPSSSSSTCQIDNTYKGDEIEQKHKFGSLIWRTSKERKKLNKAARSAKCNSGDSGIQIEMLPGSAGGGAGDSSESHDTDPPNDELDSPPAVRRRRPQISGGGSSNSSRSSRPHSDLLNQILIDKFKADLKQRAHKHQHVRRTRSDLGGRRLLNWDHRYSYRRLMSTPAPMRSRPSSTSPPEPGGNSDDNETVTLRNPNNYRRGQLRRSLSQPLDIDKLSPLMRTRTPLRPGGTNVLSEDDEGKFVTSDDDLSDSESSVASLDRKKSFELAMEEEMVILAEAVFDHIAFEEDELAFRAGDVIEVLETANRDWWWGSTNGKKGWFPAHFVRLRVSQEDTVEDCLAAMAAGKSNQSQLRRRTSISLLSNDQVRTSVVRELVHTERDFVKVLQDVAEGYIAECRKRKDMFSEDQIATIFINIEDILQFQSKFLKDLEASINWDVPYKSCVGDCFLKHSAGFKMYSDYCNSHPMATATLQELYQYNNYSTFFEACRLMRGLIEIPLDGYLLTPVQRICKYPLQLAELLKYTKTDHEDYNKIKEALEVMRGVAMLINERKRRMESLEKLAAWQQRVEGWEGEDLIEASSQLLHQGEVVRVTTGMWTNNITLFLFDHQIIYCKKDILKRNTYVYKGRICLNTCEIIDIPDGKDVHLGVNVRNAIKLHSVIRDKWLLFCCRTLKDKERWLRVFAEERKLVAQDKSDGLEFPAAAKQLARLAARRQKRPPRKPRKLKNFKTDTLSNKYMGGSALQLNTTSNSSQNSLSRKMGTWFTFGAHKKTNRHRSRNNNSYNNIP